VSIYLFYHQIKQNGPPLHEAVSQQPPIQINAHPWQDCVSGWY